MTYDYFHYTAFGLKIASDIKIPQLTKTVHDEPELVIRSGDVPDALDASISLTEQFQYSKQSFLFKSRNSGKFLLQNDDEIIYQKYPHSSFEDICFLLLSVVMGIVLHRKNKFPLHSSSIFLDGKAVVLSGLPGSGKSTLATGLIQHGAQLISDDISVIEHIDSDLCVCPGVPLLKLWPDALAALGYDVSQYQAIRAQIEKRGMVSNAFVTSPVALGSIYFLTTDQRQSIGLSELQGPAEVVRLLNSNTFRQRYAHAIGDRQQHFQTCCAIAASTRVKILNRLPEPCSPQQFVELILADQAN